LRGAGDSECSLIAPVAVDRFTSSGVPTAALARTAKTIHGSMGRASISIVESTYMIVD